MLIHHSTRHTSKYLHIIFKRRIRQTMEAYIMKIPAQRIFHVSNFKSKCSESNICVTDNIPYLSRAIVCPFDVLYGINVPSFCIATRVTYKIAHTIQGEFYE